LRPRRREPPHHRAGGEKTAEDPPIDSGTLWRAQGMRIINAKKSKYYNAALENFEQARRCYERAGLATTGDALWTKYAPTTAARPVLCRVLRKSLPTWFPVRALVSGTCENVLGYATG